MFICIINSFGIKVIRFLKLNFRYDLAFGVFQSRLLSLTEWYELYSDVMNDQDGQNKMETFLFAVYELVHLGFVRKIVTGKRGGEAYEKTAIIWGKG